MTAPTREQVQAWEDEAHNFADGFPDANETQEEWYVIFYSKLAELAHSSGRAQALDEVMHLVMTYPDWIGPTSKQEICEAIKQLKGKP